MNKIKWYFFFGYTTGIYSVLSLNRFWNQTELARTSSASSHWFWFSVLKLQVRTRVNQTSATLQLKALQWTIKYGSVCVTISSSTRTILLFILQISWTTCHERMFIYFYFLPCITRMLHASDACLSFLMLRILSSLLYHTCSTCFKHALYACFTLYIL